MDVEGWVGRYVRAWESNDPADIEGLFTEDATYLTAPHREPWTPRERIVEGWLERKDQPGTWSFEHEVLATAGDLAFVQGVTRYPQEGHAYSNLWVIRLEGDRCSGFTEWWMERPLG